MANLLELETRALLDTLAQRERGPGAGSVAALVTAIAAALAAKAARGSTGWAEAGAAAAQADALRARAAPLAQVDADAYEAALSQLDEPAGADADAERRDFRLGRALAAAADVPLQIAETAADVALLAAEVAERGNQALRPEAAGAAVLAEAAARIAAQLVEVNLATRPEDERLGAANAAAGAAAQAAATV
ncbi:MAG TPA: cyclodeaminase/cyclohydrolase family protein [Gaiellaceae bacterium]|nr:cyclodeaminase/cyclohydrolase family protein [Gaiellaceae bacterium]